MTRIESIASRDNARVVYAKKVRDGKVADLIFVEGKRLVREALRSDIKIRECFVSDSLDDTELLNAVLKNTGSVVRVSDKILASIADTQQPQGVLLIATRPAASIEHIDRRLSSAALPIVVFLNEINNPLNLGAILRTAEAAGVAGVLTSKRSADAYSPKALRAAMGSSFRLPVVECMNFEDVSRWATEKELTVTAADASGLGTYTEINWKKPRLVVFGSEAHGLTEVELDSVDEIIRIPMEKAVESLNLAVSAGIILFEARRHQVISDSS